MEKYIQIRTGDDHLIYGVLNSKKIHRKLIIFVHGLDGHKNEHQFYNAAKFFPENRFATFRFDLYSGEKKGRTLSECSVKTHSVDLNTVINRFRNDYGKIYLVGHSLGGPTILLAKQYLIESVVLWGPSFNIYEGLSSQMKFDKRINKFILNWGTEYILSNEMIESWKKLDDELLKYFQKPTKVICAGNFVLQKYWKEKLKYIKVDSEFSLIRGAGHYFDEKETEKELFIETLK